MNDVAPAPLPGAPTVVAGVAPVARVVTAALLRADRSVVGLVDPLDEPVPEPAELAADLDAGRAAGRADGDANTLTSTIARSATHPAAAR